VRRYPSAPSVRSIERCLEPYARTFAELLIDAEENHDLFDLLRIQSLHARYPDACRSDYLVSEPADARTCVYTLLRNEKVSCRVCTERRSVRRAGGPSPAGHVR